jgi:hypothetical protein
MKILEKPKLRNFDEKLAKDINKDLTIVSDNIECEL